MLTIEIIIPILFMFFMTTLGAMLVLFVKKINKKVYLICIGLASGIMISSSIFSLIIPSLEMNEHLQNLKCVPTAVGILLGAGLLTLLDWFCVRAGKTKVSKSSKLFFAMTFHNIPEGLAVGVGFGAYLTLGDSALLTSAICLAIGIGIQNFPEGFAVSLPIYAETHSKKKGFWCGFASGAVEPIMAVLGIWVAVFFVNVLPWLLAVSAGCMIMVVVSELFKDISGNQIGVWSFIFGFVFMLILDNITFI